MAAGSAPEVRQTGPNEVVMAAPAEIALDHVAAALEKLGKVKCRDLDKGVLEGRVKYGLQSVKVRVRFTDDAAETKVVIQATSDDVWGAGAKSATKRLVETLLNLDNPDYRPARMAIHPVVVVGVFIVMVVLILLAIKLIWPHLLGG